VLSRRQLIAGAATAGMVAAANKVAYASPRWGRLIVDSQTHLWLANTPERPWFGKEAQLPEQFTIERLLSIIDEAGVDRVVLVPPTLEGERIDYVQEAVKRCPGRFGIMCRIAIDKPERASKLPAWRDQAGVLGVRLNYGSPWLTNGTADWFWPAAEKANLPVMLLTNGQNSLIGPIAERHPGLTIIIDHMGISTAFMRTTQTWGDEIDNAVAGLARYPNVSVKLSSIPLFSTEPYPWRDTIPHIHRLYDVFGPLRCHWGTDQTNSFAKATYTQRITQFTEEMPFLSENDKDWIMGRSLMARLRWP
jgi:predicted TIM-barrel fold metal-dependent hydrolase